MIEKGKRILIVQNLKKNSSCDFSAHCNIDTILWAIHSNYIATVRVSECDQGVKGVGVTLWGRCVHLYQQNKLSLNLSYIRQSGYFPSYPFTWYGSLVISI